MFAGKKNLEKRFSLSTLVLAVSLILTTNVAIADADDDAKLKELERAMSGSTAQAGQKKLRTRAIVFDNQEGDKTTNNAGNVAVAQDCANLPAGVAATAVDFNIQFNVGSATVSSNSEQMLGQIAKVLSLNSNCVIVEGHTDASGNSDQNRVLSQNRATAVVDFLANRAGLDRKRLVAVGKGSSEPAKGLDARDPKNRRVAFKVVSGA